MVSSGIDSDIDSPSLPYLKKHRGISINEPLEASCAKETTLHSLISETKKS